MDDDTLDSTSDDLNKLNLSDIDKYFRILYGNESNIKIIENTEDEGMKLAVPVWEAIVTAVVLTLIIMLTVVGNILVILSVFTYKPLRIVQNFFIVSLAVADLTVALLVLPFNVADSILGQWVFGIHMCKMWLTCDVLCCTASILNLCAVALDRYWAITDPINYAQKRTLKRVLIMIMFVWLLSAAISSPPLLGWNDWPDEFTTENTECKLTEKKGYVVYSSLGSFFIPLVIMTIVYFKIFLATRRRLRERAKASRIHAVKNNLTGNQTKGSKELAVEKDKEKDSNDGESVSSETNHNDPHCSSDVANLKESSTSSTSNGGGKKGKTKSSKKKEKKKMGNSLCPPGGGIAEDSVTDNDVSTKRDSAYNCTAKDGSAAPNAQGVQPAGVKKPGVQVHQFIEERQRISLSKERRAARTLGIIMGVFILCWLPFFLMYVILPFCAPFCEEPGPKVINFITWLGYINSALNPIIYTIFNLDFRKAFKKLLHFNR